MHTTAAYLTVPGLLNTHQLEAIRHHLGAIHYVDGKETASSAAKEIKHNLQADMQSAQYGMLQQIIVEALNQNMMLRNATFPRHVYPFLFSKYEAGMEYGWHVDSPLMGNMMRTDIAITIFLSEPDSYEGGELELQSPTGTLLYKLPAGDAVCYPCTQLHRVRPVTRGVRQVAVSWIQSMVKHTEQRIALFEIQQVIDKLREANLQSPEANALQQTHSNILRMWAE